MSVQVVPTNSVKDLAVTSAKLASSLSVGQLAVTGNMGLGLAPVTNVGLYVAPNSFSGDANPWGMISAPTFPATATGAGRAVGAYVNTTAASFTLATGVAFYAGVPTLGAGSAISNTFGMYVENQGKAGITNAYGLYIVQQSGASGINAAIAFSSGTSLFRNTATSICIEARSQYLMLMSAAGTHIGYNTYWDGTNWVPINGANSFALYVVATDFTWYGAAAGTPTTVPWTAVMSLNHTSGLLTVAGGVNISNGSMTLYWDGSYANVGQNFYARGTIVTAATIDNGAGTYYFVHNSGIYVQWYGGGSGYIQFSHSLLVGQTGIYFNNSTAYGIWWNGGGFQCTHYLMSAGPVYLNSNGGYYLNVVGNGMGTSHPLNIAQGGNSPSAYCAIPSRLGTQYLVYDNGGGNCYGLGIDNGTLVLICNGSTAVRINTYNGAAQPITASAFTVVSTLSVKRDVRNLADPLSIVRDDRLHGVAFRRVHDDSPAIGFVADYWHEVLPDVVQYQFESMPEYGMPDARPRLSNRPEGLDYGAIGAITFEALKLYIQRTDARIAELEAKLAA